MGRKAGVAASETKAALLKSAARVFARRGYDGASVAEITSEAGLTSGAIYAHYGSKAELFLATLEAHAERDLDELLGRGGPDFAEGLASIGSSYDRREPVEASLLISAIVAARNHPEVSGLLVQQIAEREKLFRSAVSAAQASGGLISDASADAICRLSLMIGFGSLVTGALGLDPINHDDWADLIGRVVGAFRPDGDDA